MPEAIEIGPAPAVLRLRARAVPVKGGRLYEVEVVARWPWQAPGWGRVVFVASGRPSADVRATARRWRKANRRAADELAAGVGNKAARRLKP